MQTQRPNVRISFATDSNDRPEVRDPSIRTSIGTPNLLAALTLAILAMLSSAPAVSGQFLLNDDVNVTANVALRSWRGLVPIWTTPQRMPQLQPLSYTALLIEHRLFRDSPFGYHAVSLVLHAACVLLL